MGAVKKELKHSHGIPTFLKPNMNQYGLVLIVYLGQYPSVHQSFSVTS